MVKRWYVAMRVEDDGEPANLGKEEIMNMLDMCIDDLPAGLKVTVTQVTELTDISSLEKS